MINFSENETKKCYCKVRKNFDNNGPKLTVLNYQISNDHIVLCKKWENINLIFNCTRNLSARKEIKESSSERNYFD